MFANVDEARGALVDALLSGRFEKTEGALCRITRDGLTYCAQGVAAEVLRENGYPVVWDDTAGRRRRSIGEDEAHLPEWALEVFGLSMSTGNLLIADNDKVTPAPDQCSVLPVTSFADIAANLKAGKYDRGESK